MIVLAKTSSDFESPASMIYQEHIFKAQVTTSQILVRS